MTQFPLWTVLAACLALSVAPNPPRLTSPAAQSSATSEPLKTRVSDPETTESDTTQKQLKIKVTSLTVEERLLNIENRLETQEDLLTVEEKLIASDRKNQELMKMLSNYERFFGSLYAATPESFDPTLGVHKRLSMLNSYLGNREAVLLSLRPAPTTVVDNSTCREELLGEALYDIEQERGRMDKEMAKLEENMERMSSMVPDHAEANTRQEVLVDEEVVMTEEPAVDAGGAPGRGQSGSRGNQKGGNGSVGSCDECRRKRSIDETSSLSNTGISNDEFNDRLERLEDLMVLQLLPLINKTVGELDSSFRSIDGASASVLTNLTLLEELEEEISALRANRTESKKVAFSVARTTHLLGTDSAQLLDFDHVFLNKGGDFVEDISTFICTVPGYYLVTFTVRSYDGYVLGINLMQNDDQVTGVYMDAHNRNVMGSQTVILHLDTGDKMWLRNAPSTRFAVDSDQYKYTTFSAFLIYKGY